MTNALWVSTKTLKNDRPHKRGAAVFAFYLMFQPYFAPVGKVKILFPVAFDW